MGVPLFYSLLNPSPTRSLTSMDSNSMLTLDFSRDKDKLPKSFILMLVKSPLRLRILVPYSLISDSDIFGDNLGNSEIISDSDIFGDNLGNSEITSA